MSLTWEIYEPQSEKYMSLNLGNIRASIWEIYESQSGKYMSHNLEIYEPQSGK